MYTYCERNDFYDLDDFFQETLDLPGDTGEEEFDGFAPEDLNITTTGQLRSFFKKREQ